ncbi:unnamed protein product [Adineta steineri]|uniref:NAD(P)(+)--arginine ADP-ribosyltransferase n=2 Tax=Adineta steineri TaxID=433720 RepID=A0A815QYF9_9BILA|nr:unnamed protein product [Adineta steineri]
MEWNQPENSLHILLNQALCAIDRNQLQPWLKYIKLLFTALFKLPYAECHTVWRGIPKDVCEQYREGDEVTWWSITSTTSSFDVLQSPMYLGREKVQTIFAIETKYGKSIREHSHLQNDDEILLSPGINLKVIGSLKHADGIHIIHLRDMNSFSDSLMNVNPPVDEYRNPRLEEIIRSIEERGTLILDPMNLSDQDMEIVAKLGIIEKKCKIISLCNNAIRSVGVTILSQAFGSRTYFSALYLDENRILDAGVQCIATRLPSEELCFRKLYLNSVGMSDVGCEYLAEMLRFNHSTYHLHLSDNDVSDRGLQLLLETTQSYESNIASITLDGNRRVTDVSINAICTAISSSHGFHNLNVRNCSISDAGKEQLKVAAQQGFYFTIGV